MKLFDKVKINVNPLTNHKGGNINRKIFGTGVIIRDLNNGKFIVGFDKTFHNGNNYGEYGITELILIEKFDGILEELLTHDNEIVRNVAKIKQSS